MTMMVCTCKPGLMVCDKRLGSDSTPTMTAYEIKAHDIIFVLIRKGNRNRHSSMTSPARHTCLGTKTMHKRIKGAVAVPALGVCGSSVARSRSLA